jgi:hypothetical protein
MFNYIYKEKRRRNEDIIAKISDTYMCICLITYDDDDVYVKKNTTRVAQNLILHKNAHQPKA